MLKQVIIGYIAIFSFYFLVKAAIYHTVVLTRGVVINEYYCDLASTSGRLTPNRNEARMYYPVALFRGPEIVPLQSEIPKTFHEIMAQNADSTKNNTEVDSEALKNKNLFTTSTPTGSYFSRDYQIGDSVDIFYYPDKITEAKVLDFSSYWLPLFALYPLLFVCFIWTAICKLRVMIKKDWG